jgi:demethylmenaquinone methyltransferase/2-methoxy-6-polyprenyl-1,4-benzoquinol methylase
MSAFFSWTAPLFKLSRHRFTDADFRHFADYVRPCIPPGGRLLDLGGGTGDLGLGVGKKLGADVVVADVTPEMLFLVSAHPSMSVRLSAAEALPFPDAYFDGLLCSDAFHHFRDQEAAVREMARVVRPGGCVLVFEFRRAGFGHFLVFVERRLGEPGSFLEPNELRALLASGGVEGTITQKGFITYTFAGHNREGGPRS